MSEDDSFSCAGSDSSRDIEPQWQEALPADFDLGECPVDEEYKEGYCVWHYDWDDEPDDPERAIRHLFRTLSQDIDRVDGAHLAGLELSPERLGDIETSGNDLGDLLSVDLPFAKLNGMTVREGNETDNEHNVDSPISDLSETEFENVSLELCDFRYSIVAGLDFVDCDVNRVDFEGCRVKKVDSEGRPVIESPLRFTDCEIHTSNFDLLGTWPREDEGGAVRFEKTDLPNCSLEETDLRLTFDADEEYGEIDAHDSSFRKSRIRELELPSNCDLDLEYTIWELSRVDEVVAPPNGDCDVRFERADLTRVDFSELTLRNFDFEKADLSATNFQDTELIDPRFYDTNVEDIRINRATNVKPSSTQRSTGGTLWNSVSLCLSSAAYLLMYGLGLYAVYLPIITASQRWRERIRKQQLFGTSAPGAVKTDYETERDGDDAADLENLHKAVAQNQGLKQAHSRWGLEAAADFTYQYWKLREKLQRRRAKANLRRKIPVIGREHDESGGSQSGKEADRTGFRRSVSGPLLRAAPLSVHGVLSDYGENPFKVVQVSVGIIISFAWIYLLFGNGFLINGSVVVDGGAAPFGSGVFQKVGNDSFQVDCSRTVECPPDGGESPTPHRFLKHLQYTLYFSTITFTTLGYAGTAPAGTSRYIAMIQSFLGGLMMAYIVFVVGHRIGQ